MKIRIRFTKTGTMQYIGHLDLMRYFQKLFRRCGFDVSYSQGFNPHQLMSFASPLGLGVTTVADYLDVSLESFVVTNSSGDEKVGKTLSVEEWIDRINSYSNEMVTVTGIYVLKDDAKPSMSLLSATSYVVYGLTEEYVKGIVDYYNNSDSIIYVKQTKKSSKDIDLKQGFMVVARGYDKYAELSDRYAIRDAEYEDLMAKDDKALYLLCHSGSDNNIKPDMLLEAYSKYIEPEKEFNKYTFDIVRTDMFYGSDRYISMAL